MSLFGGAYRHGQRDLQQRRADPAGAGLVTVKLALGPPFL